MREDDGVLLGILEDDFAPGVEPEPMTIPTLNPEVHSLNLLALDHWGQKQIVWKVDPLIWDLVMIWLIGRNR